LCNRAGLWSIFSQRECAMSPEEEVLEKILTLQEKRDNIIYLLAHEELSDAITLQLETQLSSVEDELVLLCIREAA
jgi:hypothetical protein